MIGTILDQRWEITGRLGEGGMGIVYRARQLSDGRAVAVKVLSETLARDPSWVHRFQNEARAVAALRHPATVRLLECGQSPEGILYIVMELLVGHTLRHELDQGRPLPPSQVVDVLRQVVPSLTEAHKLGIIHRDVKPDNLFLLDSGAVKVLDFSVAKLKQQAQHGLQTAAGIVFGTPQYMSPEQGRGLPVDARSDLYSLGIVAFEMLTGRVPFHAADPMDVLAMHVQQPLPAMPGAPAALDKIVRKLLAKDPAKRYQRAADLDKDLAPLSPPPAGARTGPSLAVWTLSVAAGVAAGLLSYLLIDALR